MPNRLCFKYFLLYSLTHSRYYRGTLLQTNLCSFRFGLKASFPFHVSVLSIAWLQVLLVYLEKLLVGLKLFQPDIFNNLLDNRLLMRTFMLLLGWMIRYLLLLLTTSNKRLEIRMMNEFLNNFIHLLMNCMIQLIYFLQLFLRINRTHTVPYYLCNLRIRILFLVRRVLKLKLVL